MHWPRRVGELDVFSRLRLSPSSAGQFVLQLAGQSGVPYVLQTSTDLSNWTSVATNVLSGNALEITNPTTPRTSAHFWLAAWVQ